MTMLVALLVVAACSYALRVTPLLLVDRVRVSDRTRTVLGHATQASLAGILAHALASLARNPVPGPVAAQWVGLIVGAAAALLGWSLGRVAVVGMLAYAAVRLAFG